MLDTLDSQTLEAAEAVLDRLAAEVETPVYSGLPLPQGDVLVLPADGKVPAAMVPIPTAGVPLVRGDGGHVHLLLGRVLWAPGPQGAQTVGTVTVPEGDWT